MPFMKGKPNPHGKVAYSKLSYEEQLEYKRLANRASYLRKIGGKLSRNLNRTPEDRLQRARDKAANRCTRAKQARVIWNKDFTNFVYSEAHELRKLRNKLTNIEWHVDHIIPLKGKEVSGLHVWNNFRVIPKTLNLSKGAKFAVHEKWQEGLREGVRMDQEDGRSEENCQTSPSPA